MRIPQKLLSVLLLCGSSQVLAMAKAKPVPLELAGEVRVPTASLGVRGVWQVKASPDQQAFAMYGVPLGEPRPDTSHVVFTDGALKLVRSVEVEGSSWSVSRVEFKGQPAVEVITQAPMRYVFAWDGSALESRKLTHQEFWQIQNPQGPGSTWWDPVVGLWIRAHEPVRGTCRICTIFGCNEYSTIKKQRISVQVSPNPVTRFVYRGFFTGENRIEVLDHNHLVILGIEPQCSQHDAGRGRLSLVTLHGSSGDRESVDLGFTQFAGPVHRLADGVFGVKTDAIHYSFFTFDPALRSPDPKLTAVLTVPTLPVTQHFSVVWDGAAAQGPAFRLMTINRVPGTLALEDYRLSTNSISPQPSTRSR